MPGDKGLPYLIDLYRRYAEWSRPLIQVLSEAVCRAERQPLPDPGLGFTKRCELLKTSKWGKAFDCLDPRIRNAASHSGVQYDHDRGIVRFSEVDGDGNALGYFEMTYVQAADTVRELQKGLIPGLLNAFGMRQQTLIRRRSPVITRGCC